MGISFDLEQAIWRTLCWFSLFDYPLTAFEVWKWLHQPAGSVALADVFEALAQSQWLAERMETADGFYARRGGPAIASLIATRQERFLDAMRKFGKLQQATRWFALLPAVEGVAAANTLAWWNTKPDSDIDLFIIVRPGTMWATRFMLVAPFALTGRRPQERAADPFCFSFFVTHERLALEALQLPGQNDPYLAYWCASLVPLLDRGNVFSDFMKKNTWMTRTIPLARPVAVHPQLRVRGRMTVPCHAHLIEGTYRNIQTRRLPARIRDMMNKDSRVIVDDDMLKFHDNDRREAYRAEFDARVLKV